MPDTETALKLIALDEEDLAIISAHVQDSCVQSEEIAYLPLRRSASSWRRCATIGARRRPGAMSGSAPSCDSIA